MKFSLTIQDLCWAPPEWTCNGFPLEAAEQETVNLEAAVSVLHAQIDTITQEDSTALGPAIHVAHILIGWQDHNGEWPVLLNARTGASLSEKRTRAPLTLYDRLAELLETTEFDHVIERSRQHIGSTDSHLAPEKEP